MSYCIVATCNLDQWAMDFDLNVKHVMESIEKAKKKGATFRTGPELELSGYGCEDHFYEHDTITHCWESLCSILTTSLTNDILCDIGMPVIHQGVRYNCRIWCLNQKIVAIRPKMYLADDGNYRESRWFTAWTRHYDVDQYALPLAVRTVTGQTFVPFGSVMVVVDDTSLASESCEELFTPMAPGIRFGLSGAEIIANGSGSHHNLRKLEIRMDLIREACRKSGGCYLYANQQGCDGGRLYYDGCSSICINGSLVAQGSQFSVYDVEVITAAIDLDDIRSYRAASASRSVQAASTPHIPTVHVPFRMTREINIPVSQPISLHVHLPEEEIALGPACWLWDYLRRSGAAGFFLPLSGGADSSATATIVGSMCQLVFKAAIEGDQQVIHDLRRIIISGGTQKGEWETSTYIPTNPSEIANHLFYSCYMGTSNSSDETRNRARTLAQDIGQTHVDINIDSVVSSILGVFKTLTGKIPRYKTQGGIPAENLALQNIQARSRMILAYLCAQLLPWSRGRPGYLLVLGSANVDEALRGYLTKYDCSSADINPIGGISKGDLKRFLQWATTNLGYPSLQSVVDAVPTAELEPISDEYKQTDEADMGMSYEELGLYGRLRKIYRCGPVSMYVKLCDVWKEKGLSPRQVAEKVRTFFTYYASNRHKVTTLTPSYHAENYSPEDNRFDLRQFLYNTRWTRQYHVMDELVRKTESTGRRSSQKDAAIQEGIIKGNASL